MSGVVVDDMRASEYSTRIVHTRRPGRRPDAHGVLGHFGWWPGSAVIAGLAGALLMVLWFNAWLTVGLTISVTVLIAGIRAFTSS